MSYDVVVIGGGPAGLSAALNVRARGRNVLVVTNPPEENPLWKAERVDNYLGMPGLSGAELLEQLRRHAEAAGAEFRTGKVLSAMPMEDTWYLSIGTDMEHARALVLAAGVNRGKKFPGETEFLGRGVSYCATCDGMLYRGKPVAVLGYTPTARHEAEFLEGIGCSVTYFERPASCTIRGGSQVEEITCDGKTAAVAGVFILRPTMAPTELFPGLAVENGYVTVDRRMATNLPGVFAAGDCTGGPLQVSKATGEGLCVIDLDTVMPGLAVHDFGDSIRFGASTAAEDEKDLSKVSCSMELFELYAKGYIEGCGGKLTDKEIELLPMGAKTMTFECGMRFLTDYLQGDTYFKVHREGHNLDRCRTQFKLVEDMDQKWYTMNEIVKKLSTQAQRKVIN